MCGRCKVASSKSTNISSIKKSDDTRKTGDARPQPVFEFVAGKFYFSVTEAVSSIPFFSGLLFWFLLGGTDCTTVSQDWLYNIPDIYIPWYGIPPRYLTSRIWGTGPSVLFPIPSWAIRSAYTPWNPTYDVETTTKVPVWWCPRNSMEFVAQKLKIN